MIVTAAVFRHAIEAIANPFFFWVLLLMMTFLWFFLQNKGRKTRCALVGIFLLFGLLSTAWLPRSLIHHLGRQYAVVEHPDPSLHWVVVLGGGQRASINAPANHLLSNPSLRRLIEGVRLYHELPEAKLIVSGGSERMGAMLSESVRMRELTRWFSIPETDVLLENTSVNTADEVMAIKSMVHQDAFYLVTSSIHMPRAMALCQKQGLNPIAAPADYPYDDDDGWQKDLIPNPYNLFIMNVAWHEFLGRAWGVVRGII